MCHGTKIPSVKNGKWDCKRNLDKEGKKKGKGRKCNLSCDKGYKMKNKRAKMEKPSQLLTVSSNAERNQAQDGRRSQRTLPVSRTKFYNRKFRPEVSSTCPKYIILLSLVYTYII